MYFLGVQGIDETDRYNWWDQQDIFAPRWVDGVKASQVVLHWSVKANPL